MAIRNHPELLKERQDLIAERKKLPRTSPRYVQIGRKLTQIRNKLSSEEKETVKNVPQITNYVNNFFGDIKDSQIQEGSKDSSQIMEQ